MIYYKFLLIGPEIFMFIFIAFFIIFFSFLQRRLIIYNSSNNQKRFFTLNLSYSAWNFIFMLTMIYFTLIFTTEDTFSIVEFGLVSNKIIYGLRLILCFLFLVFLLYLRTEIKDYKIFNFEFYVILLTSFVLLHFILLSNTFINLFIFIEFFSLCIYYLVATQKKSMKSLEAGIKYFIFGSISSILLLFGFFLVYFSTGSNCLTDIYLLSFANPILQQNYIYILGCFLIIISIFLKIGVGLFYFWIVDIYDGIDYPLFIYINIFPKVVYTYLLFTLVEIFNLSYLEFFIKFFFILNLIISAIGAITQVKVKRFLIFTSLYNLTFFAANFWDDVDYSRAAIFLIFSFFYLFNSLIYMITFVSIKDWNSNIVIKNLLDLTNLFRQNKTLAYSFSLLTFIIAGLPPTTMFLVKFTVLYNLSKEAFLIWVFFLLFVTLITYFYYIRIIKLIFTVTPNFSLFLKPLHVVTAYLIALTIYFNVVFVFFLNYAVLYLDFFFFF